MQPDLFFHPPNTAYSPRPVACFEPSRIVLARGWNKTDSAQKLVEKILAVYPDIVPEDCSHLSHAKIPITGQSPFEQHVTGKQTLVIGEHKSAVRLSSEEGNTCPNYWHFSLYGFCPFGCTYCYLVGTPGVKFSPSVKIFTNIDEVLHEMSKFAKTFDRPIAFYHGKLQDGLALDPLTGYSRQLVPFFAEQKFARLVLLTKSAAVQNLLDLDHAGHTILSWTLHPPEIAEHFEPNTPPISERILAMQLCAEAGYPVRAVVMPLIPVDNWLEIYADFLKQLLKMIPLQRLTIGAICSYQGAAQLMNRKLGPQNAIAEKMCDEKSEDGRMRYPAELREKAYRYLIQAAKRVRPDLEIGLCLETHGMFDVLGMWDSLGKCNCIW